MPYSFRDASNTKNVLLVCVGSASLHFVVVHLAHIYLQMYAFIFTCIFVCIFIYLEPSSFISIVFCVPQKKKSHTCLKKLEVNYDSVYIFEWSWSEFRTRDAHRQFSYWLFHVFVSYVLTVYSLYSSYFKYIVLKVFLLLSM